MTTHLLIPWTWRGGWCWQRAAPYLPSHEGRDPVEAAPTTRGERLTCVPVQSRDLSGTAFVLDHPRGSMVFSAAVAEPARSGENDARAPKPHIESTRDEGLLLDLQRDLADAIQDVTVHAPGSDHAPFLSHPADLPACLDRVATHA